jgi:hypothetical protein
MPSQVFPRCTNTLARAMVFGFVPLIAVLVWVPYMVMCSPLATGVGVAREQPVPFSHARSVIGRPSHYRWNGVSRVIAIPKNSSGRGEYVFNMQWQPPSDQETLGRRLVEQYQIKDVRGLTTCSICHF